MLVFFTCSPTQSSLSFCISKTKHIFSFCANLCSETVDFKCLCLTHIKKGFPCGSAGKESVCNTGDLGSIPGLGRSPEEGKGYPLQYSGLENSMDRIVHGITESTWLSLSLHIKKRGQISLKAKIHKTTFVLKCVTQADFFQVCSVSVLNHSWPTKWIWPTFWEILLWNIPPQKIHLNVHWKKANSFSNEWCSQQAHRNTEFVRNLFRADCLQSHMEVDQILLGFNSVELSAKFDSTFITSMLTKFGLYQVALVVNYLPANAGDIRDPDLILGSGRSPGRGNGNSLQCSCLENPTDRGAWQDTVCGVSKSWTWLKRLNTQRILKQSPILFWLNFQLTDTWLHWF